MIFNVGDTVELDYPSLVNYDYKETIARRLDVGIAYKVTNVSESHLTLEGSSHMYMKKRFKLVEEADITESFRRVAWIEVLLADGHIQYSKTKDSWYSHLESKVYIVGYLNGAWKMYQKSNNIQPRNANGITKLETGKQAWIGGVL